MSRRHRHVLRAVWFAAGVMALWLLSTEPWGLGVFQLVMFMAPGALLGLGAAWMFHVASPDTWTWRSGRRAALIGATTLPPLLAFLVAVDGNSRPHALLAGFVYAAWLALFAGALAAIVQKLRS